MVNVREMSYSKPTRLRRFLQTFRCHFTLVYLHLLKAFISGRGFILKIQNLVFPNFWIKMQQKKVMKKKLALKTKKDLLLTNIPRNFSKYHYRLYRIV